MPPVQSKRRPRESVVSLEVRKHLEARGWWASKIVASAEQRSGLPDIIAACDGRMFGIEVKVIATSKCKLDYTPKQRSTLNRFVKHDIPALGLAYAWKTNTWVLETFLDNTPAPLRTVFEKLDHVVTQLECFY